MRFPGRAKEQRLIRYSYRRVNDGDSRLRETTKESRERPRNFERTIVRTGFCACREHTIWASARNESGSVLLSETTNCDGDAFPFQMQGCLLFSPFFKQRFARLSPSLFLHSMGKGWRDVMRKGMEMGTIRASCWGFVYDFARCSFDALVLPVLRYFSLQRPCRVSCLHSMCEVARSNY